MSSEAKTLLITGGASGIGAETARRAAAHGYKIAINYRSRDAQAKAVVADIADNVIVMKGGEIVANIDEPTGGTHLSLVVAGAYRIPFEKAERRKRSPKWQAELLPVVRPTLEKVATIVGRAIEGHDVDTIHLVGGTAAFPGIADIMTDITGVPAYTAPQPMLVTPLGAAAWAEPLTKGGR